jgi:DNA-binding CsgD family transcriptional regulator
MIVPFIYAIVLLWAIFRAIRHKYEENRNKNEYLEEIAMHFAVIPWAALAFFGLVEESQLIEVLCTNSGIIVITVLFLIKSIGDARYELNKKTKEATIGGISQEEFMANSLYYGLTRTEILLIQRLYKGLKNSEIAGSMFISEETVKKHIQNIFRKTSVKNRAALIHKLQNRRQ